MRQFFNLLLACFLLMSMGFAQVQFKAPSISFPTDASYEQIALGLARDLGLPADFALKKELDKRSPINRYITFQQTYADKPLQEAGVKIALDEQGKVLWAMDFLKKGLNMPDANSRWTVSEQAIRMRLLKQFRTLDVQLEKVWYVDEQGVSPVWRAWTFSHSQAGSYEVIIHAQTGVELARTDRAMYHNHKTAADTSGKARVWSPNPITQSGQPYNSLFANNSDQHSAAFEPFIDTVVLQNITFENGVFKLEGPYVKIVDLRNNTIAPVTSSDGNFYFTRDQSGWEDVMVYYHIDTYQRYIQSLGFTNLWGDLPLQADPHGRGDDDNSSFTPDGDDSYLLFGEGGVDDAEDGDVILHEYGHGLAFAASPNTNSGRERSGLDEGFGDYFAASFSYDLNAGGYGWGDVMNWDGHNPFWDGRQADNTEKYRVGQRNIYITGALWASTMMEVRQTIGGQLTDRLQFEMLYGLTPNMLVPDAARLVIAADWRYNAGQNEGALRTIFCSRDILSGTDCLLTSNEELAKPQNWQAISSARNLIIDWKLQPLAWHAEVSDIQGRIIGSLNREANSLNGLTPGFYVVNMKIDGKVVGAKKVVVE
ncbi:MAG: hypothetical protein AB8F95_04590 [Bacteroidia bacterium]